MLSIVLNLYAHAEVNLKVLSSEMDLDKSRLIRKGPY